MRQESEVQHRVSPLAVAVATASVEMTKRVLGLRAREAQSSLTSLDMTDGVEPWSWCPRARARGTPRTRAH